MKLKDIWRANHKGDQEKNDQTPFILFVYFIYLFHEKRLLDRLESWRQISLDFPASEAVQGVAESNGKNMNIRKINAHS